MIPSYGEKYVFNSEEILMTYDHNYNSNLSDLAMTLVRETPQLPPFFDFFFPPEKRRTSLKSLTLHLRMPNLVFENFSQESIESHHQSHLYRRH